MNPSTHQVLDSIYVSKIAPQLPLDVRQRMTNFARDELVVSSPAGYEPSWQWIRALSARDALAIENITKRPDHGVTGSYAAWPAMVAEGLASLDGGWGESSGALALLRGAAAVTLEGPLGQAHELRQPCDGIEGPRKAPSWRMRQTRRAMALREAPKEEEEQEEDYSDISATDDCENSPPFKSFREFTRYMADNGGAFVDVIIRSLFGYTPKWSA